MSLTVTRSNGTSDVVFSLQQQVGNKRIFSNPAAGLVEPETIVLESILRPQGARGTDRYNLQATKVFLEDTTNNTIAVSAKLTVSIPRSTESGLATSVADQIAFLKSMLSAANITAMIAGALPDGDNHVDTFNPA
jgi:uncharacterized protein (DUF885 family)